MKVVIPFALIFVGLAALIAMGVTQGGIPELQVEQVLAGEYPGREVKVHGFLESIQSGERPLRFKVRAKESPDVMMDVVCDRTKPDTFQKDYDVAVQGYWNPDDNTFVAEQIFTKCPSKYEAEAKEGLGSPDMVLDPAAADETSN